MLSNLFNTLNSAFNSVSPWIWFVMAALLCVYHVRKWDKGKWDKFFACTWGCLALFDLLRALGIIPV